MDIRSAPTYSTASTVEIITWFLMVASAFSIVGRISTKLAMTKKLGPDDVSAIISLVFSLGAGASVSVLAENGLGFDESASSDASLRTFQKSLYSMELLYIISLCFSNLSIILFLRKLSPNKYHQKLGFALGGLIVGWGCISLVIAIFQCRPPHVWQTIDGHCYDRAAFWRAVALMNIVEDILLITLPMVIILDLQIATRKKITVLSCFGSKGFDIVAAACQIAYTNGGSSSSTLNVWRWILCAQTLQTISLITSSIPCLRPLLEAFGSGMLVNDDITRHGVESRYANGYTKRPDHEYILRDVSNGSSSTDSQIHTTRAIRDPENPDLPDLAVKEFHNSAHIAFVPKEEREPHSRSSSQRSESRIIKATTIIETSWHNRFQG